MNDDELIRRLRRTFVERATALEPSPGQVPAPTETPAPTVLPGPWGASGDTTGNDIVMVTGPVPALDRHRRRRAPVAAVAALAAAAAAVAVGVALSGHGRSGVRLVNPAATARGARPPGSPAPTGLPAPTVAPQPAPTTGAGGGAVPAGFRAFSVTFVSPDDGWSLGVGPCGGTLSCPQVAATTDAGASWHLVGAPAVTEPAGGWAGQPFQLRFADLRDGWIYTTDPGGSGGSRLWSTHDGGLTWTAIPDPAGPDGSIFDLEASGGMAHLISRNRTAVAIYDAAVTGDNWRPAPLTLPLGAGPVATAQLVLWGDRGWAVVDNRTAIAGARLGPSGWTATTPPCARADGPALLAAASATDLVAVCQEGAYGPPEPGTGRGPWLLRSSDAGAHWVPVGPVPAAQVTSVTAAPGSPDTVVAAGTGGLLRSTDGGRTWNRVHTSVPAAGGGTEGPTFVGFTTATQAVSIDPGVAGGLLITRDAGSTWTPVPFGAG